MFPSQGPNGIEKSQFETQAADHLVYMHKSPSSDYCELLLGAPKKITGMMSVPVIAKTTAIPAPVAPNITAQVSATSKRTPFLQGLGIPTIRKEINVRQPKLRESSPAADVPASTFENSTHKKPLQILLSTLLLKLQKQKLRSSEDSDPENTDLRQKNQPRLKNLLK